jgi:hypothetical protein
MERMCWSCACMYLLLLNRELERESLGWTCFFNATNDVSPDKCVYWVWRSRSFHLRDLPPPSAPFSSFHRDYLPRKAIFIREFLAESPNVTGTCANGNDEAWDWVWCAEKNDLSRQTATARQRTNRHHINILINVNPFTSFRWSLTLESIKIEFQEIISKQDLWSAETNSSHTH